MIRSIVCAFTREELPTSWLQVFRRFEHAITKAGWKIRVRLEPLEQLPEQYDLIVVSPDLRARAEAATTNGAFVFVTTRQSAADAADQLLRELARGDVLHAEKADPNAPKIVTHRGMEMI